MAKNVKTIKTFKKATPDSDPATLFNQLVGQLGINAKTIEEYINKEKITKLIPHETTSTWPDPKVAGVGAVIYYKGQNRPIFSDGLDWRYSDGLLAP